jgi:hypothetical protein
MPSEAATLVAAQRIIIVLKNLLLLRIIIILNLKLIKVYFNNIFV